MGFPQTGSVLALLPTPRHVAHLEAVATIDWSVLKFDANGGVGFWSLYDSAYRIPVFATFLVMLTALTIFPLKKNLEHLIAHSAAVVVATQFWYPHQGGVYVLWYLPLLLIVTEPVKFPPEPAPAKRVRFRPEEFEEIGALMMMLLAASSSRVASEVPPFAIAAATVILPAWLPVLPVVILTSVPPFSALTILATSMTGSFSFGVKVSGVPWSSLTVPD